MKEFYEKSDNIITLVWGEEGGELIYKYVKCYDLTDIHIRRSKNLTNENIHIVYNEY